MRSLTQLQNPCISVSQYRNVTFVAEPFPKKTNCRYIHHWKRLLADFFSVQSGVGLPWELKRAKNDRHE